MERKYPYLFSPDRIRHFTFKNRLVIEYRISGIVPEVDPVLFEESVVFIKEIENKIDILHVSSGALENEEEALHTFPTYLEPQGTNIHLAAALKSRVDVPSVKEGIRCLTNAEYPSQRC